ncbi:helix-turn-helix domain-containing protein [Bacillus sp. IITD106]|nr:helix-turn-helix domain-containing protein [Bacillus sp. IITD106]
MIDVGERIRKLRDERRWSLRELESRTGINYSVISRIESGKRPITDQEINIFCNIFGVSSEYLLGRTDKREYGQEPKHIELTEKDEIDIAKRMELMRKDLMEGSADGEGLSYKGEPMSKEAIDSLLESLELLERQTTLINKKFIPKKHRNNQ